MVPAERVNAHAFGSVPSPEIGKRKRRPRKRDLVTRVCQRTERCGETFFAGMSDLVLVAVGAEELGGALKWETARGGALFPHLYGPLPLAAVRGVQALRLDDDGRHVLPRLDA